MNALDRSSFPSLQNMYDYSAENFIHQKIERCDVSRQPNHQYQIGYNHDKSTFVSVKDRLREFQPTVYSRDGDDGDDVNVGYKRYRSSKEITRDVNSIISKYSCSSSKLKLEQEETRFADENEQTTKFRPLVVGVSNHECSLLSQSPRSSSNRIVSARQLHKDVSRIKTDCDTRDDYFSSNRNYKYGNVSLKKIGKSIEWKRWSADSNHENYPYNTKLNSSSSFKSVYEPWGNDSKTIGAGADWNQRRPSSDIGISTRWYLSSYSSPNHQGVDSKRSSSESELSNLSNNQNCSQTKVSSRLNTRPISLTHRSYSVPNNVVVAQSLIPQSSKKKELSAMRYIIADKNEKCHYDAAGWKNLVPSIEDRREKESNRDDTSDNSTSIWTNTKNSLKSMRDRKEGKSTPKNFQVSHLITKCKKPNDLESFVKSNSLNVKTERNNDKSERPLLSHETVGLRKIITSETSEISTNSVINSCVKEAKDEVSVRDLVRSFSAKAALYESTAKRNILKEEPANEIEQIRISLRSTVKELGGIRKSLNSKISEASLNLPGTVSLESRNIACGRKNKALEELEMVRSLGLTRTISLNHKDRVDKIQTIQSKKQEQTVSTFEKKHNDANRTLSSEGKLKSIMTLELTAKVEERGIRSSHLSSTHGEKCGNRLRNGNSASLLKVNINANSSDKSSDEVTSSKRTHTDDSSENDRDNLYHASSFLSEYTTDDDIEVDSQGDNRFIQISLSSGGVTEKLEPNIVLSPTEDSSLTDAMLITSPVVSTLDSLSDGRQQYERIERKKIRKPLKGAKKFFFGPSKKKRSTTQ